MEKNLNTREQTLLRVCGILMIIFGAICIAVYLAGTVLLVGVTYATSGVFSGSRDLIGMGLNLAGAISELVAGILGVRAARSHRRPRRKLIFWGLLTLVFSLGGTAFVALRTAGTSWVNAAISLALGTVVPTVYLAAVCMMRKPRANDE